jgi:hypothetical protein
MSEMQIANHSNDIYKNELIKNTNYTLYRFWESEINKIDYESKLKKLWERK